MQPGAEGLYDILRSDLAFRLPAKLTQLATRLGLAAGSLPMPGIDGPQEAMLIPWERHPIILVVVTDTLGMVDQGKVAAGREWLTRYRVRQYVFARGTDTAAASAPSYDTAARAAKRYTLAMRELLLAARTLVDGAGVAQPCVTEPRSLVESYSEISPVDAGRSLAAAYLQFEVGVAEVLPS